MVEYGKKKMCALHLPFSFLPKWIDVSGPCFVLVTNAVPVHLFLKPAGFSIRKRDEGNPILRVVYLRQTEGYATSGDQFCCWMREF